MSILKRQQKKKPVAYDDEGLPTLAAWEDYARRRRFEHTIEIAVTLLAVGMITFLVLVIAGVIP